MAIQVFAQLAPQSATLLVRVHNRFEEQLSFYGQAHQPAKCLHHGHPGACPAAAAHLSPPHLVVEVPNNDDTFVKRLLFGIIPERRPLTT